MNFYRLFIFSGLIALTFICSSQEIDWRGEIVINKNFHAPQVLGVANERVYLIQQSIQKYERDDMNIRLSVFDKKLSLLTEKTILAKSPSNKRIYLGTFLLNDTISILTVEKKVGDGLFTIVAERYDLETFELVQKKVLKIFHTKVMPRENEIFVVPSDDHAYFCITWFNHRDYKQLPSEVFFQVYDHNLHLIWKREIAQFRPGQAFEIDDIDLTDEGDLLIGGFLYHGEKRNKRSPSDTPNYIYQGIVYQNHGADSMLFSFDLEEKYIRDAILSYVSDSLIVCGGFYNHIDPQNPLEQIYHGTFFSYINPQLKEQEVKTAPFTQIVRYSEKGEKTIVNKDAGYKEYYLKQMQHLPKGNTRLIIQKGPYLSVFTFNEQAERIGADLFSHEKYPSVNFTFQNGRFYLIYSKLEKASKGSGGKTRNTYVSHITEEGNWERNALFSQDKKEKSSLPRLSLKINKETWLVIRLSPNSTHQLGILKYTFP